jgi:rhodanese-related sulfurtransferase
MGHPAGAVNVPLIDRDPRTGHMHPNPDFVTVMQANFPPETKLLIGCQVGGRSMRASQMLEGVRLHRRD